MKLCSICGNEKDGKHQSYCKFCFCWYIKTRLWTNPEDLIKFKAREKAKRALKRGKIFKHPCSCGSNESEMHHPDYSKPLDVVWMCKKCHHEFHILERRVLCALS